MGKAMKVIEIGFKLFAGLSAGYFVFKATDNIANELAKDGGTCNAFIIGAGQSALVAATGILVAYTIA